MDRKEICKKVLEGTRNWFINEAHYKSLEDARAVIGISGGKDSSVVAAILTKILGKDNVYGIMMPNGVQKDIDYSVELCNLLGIRPYLINIEGAYNGLLKDIVEYPSFKDAKSNPTVTTNLPARLRMATLYSIAAIVNGRVIGTGNKSEIICGYYTLWGDGACDFDPIANLYVDEVIELGRELGLPEKFVSKIPSDGMSGVSDEEKLGFTYAEARKCWELPLFLAERELGKEKFNRISEKINSTNFKRNLTNIPFVKLDR